MLDWLIVDPFLKTPPIFKFNPFSKNYQTNALGRWELFIVQRKFTSEKNVKILFKLPGEWEKKERESKVETLVEREKQVMKN